jgi:hypothetical protein
VAELRLRVLGEKHPDTLRTMTLLGDVALRQYKYVRAEALLRKATAVYEKTGSNEWERYAAQVLLGISLAAQKRYADGEPLLTGGYEGMVDRSMTMPAGERHRITEACERIVELYQRWGKPNKAAEWESKARLPNGSAGN